MSDEEKEKREKRDIYLNSRSREAEDCSLSNSSKESLGTKPPPPPPPSPPLLLLLLLLEKKGSEDCERSLGAGEKTATSCSLSQLPRRDLQETQLYYANGRSELTLG